MQRPTVAEIDLAALRYNYHQVTKLSDSSRKFLAIVKANAYGHGAVKISQELEKCGVDFLGVAMCEEAAELRKAGIKSSILVMGGIFHNQSDDVFKYDLIPVIFDMESARSLNARAAQNGIKLKVHVKLDTGMGRVGILPSDVEAFFSSIKDCHQLQVDGLLTHLAIADATDDTATSFTCGQIDTFTSLVKKVKEMGFSPTCLHLANSAAIIRKLDPCFNLVRPGIMLYGICPSPSLLIDLKPVLSLKTKIIALKKVPKGCSISYRRTFISERESLIATLPIGYADGYSRQFSNRSTVVIHGRRAPVAGVVCMDMTMVDVTDIPAVNLHDEVVLLGAQGSQSINAQELAEMAHSIPYEILCGISSRVPRQYLNGC